MVGIMNIKAINNALPDNVIVHELRKHSKASEKYVDVTFIDDDGFKWKGSIPYYYRRTGLFIESEKDLAEYLLSIKKYFTKSQISIWNKNEKEYWDLHCSNKQVTKDFFYSLLDFDWKSVSYDLPKNPNWARRIQDIKEMGYTLSTNTKMKVKNQNQNDTHILLVPLPRGGSTGYETISKRLKDKIIKTLSAKNAFEDRVVSIASLIPDHKFPEIRWDETTKCDNLDEMSSEEIKAKFQLLDNQRNQQKREVCRRCFQENKRGVLFGIRFWYAGGEDWDADIPKTGKKAERGCFGCGWYDIEAWRKKLTERIQSNN